MDKTRNNTLIKYANEALQDQKVNQDFGISKILNDGNIEEAYNGSVASLSVSIAMSELRPALAIYYQDKPNSNSKPKANRRSVLDAVARIITKDAEQKKLPKWNFSKDERFARNLFEYAIIQEDAELKQEVIDCAIALKQIIRTYNLV